MKILIAYDIPTKSKAARKRYRKIFRICKSVGFALQKSVFECTSSKNKLKKLEIQLKSILDLRSDRILLVILKSNSIQRRFIMGKHRSPSSRCCIIY